MAEVIIIDEAKKLSKKDWEKIRKELRGSDCRGGLSQDKDKFPKTTV